MEESELRPLLEMNHQASYGWALACCARDSVEAESVLQAVYLKVLEGRARFEGRSSFKTWLFAVIRKTAIDERRRSMLRGLRLIKLGQAALFHSSSESPDEAVYRSQIEVLFQHALSRLPRRQREVLQLVFYHDFTVAGAAKVMGCSIGSARTHYERGKKRLYSLIDETGVFDESGLAREENKRTVP